MTLSISRSSISRLQSYSPWLMLVTLLTLTYGYFSQAIYAGFRWAPDGQIDEVYVTPEPSPSLRAGDRLIEVGPIHYSEFQQDWRRAWLDGFRPGDTVQLVVERNDQHLPIDWYIPGLNSEELLHRLNNQWYLAYIFWVVGTVVVLILRPIDSRWRLLVAFNYLTALWLLTGSLAQFHLWGSLFILRASIWISVPIYLHLHWILPRPLSPLPRLVFILAYLVTALLVGAEWLQLLPRSAYYIGLAVALAGSLALMLAHLILQADRRRDITLLATVAGVAILPTILIGIAGAFNPAIPNIIGGALFALPLIPITYLYTAYRRQLGDLEIRANQIISVYIYIVLLGTACFLTVAAALAVVEFNGEAVIVSTFVSIIAALLTAFGYHRFQRLIEHHLLNIPMPPAELVETYAARIATSLTESTLIELLDKEVLTSLLIRQTALMLSDGKTVTLLYQIGVPPTQLPAGEDVSKLLAVSGRQRTLDNEPQPAPCAWARLVLPLTVDQNLVGVWLFGRHDPDDFYSQREIAILQSLTYQTAIALTNMMQATRLRALYQNDVDQREAERRSVARELHDSVLKDLKLLRDTVHGEAASPEFLQFYGTLSSGLRQIIANLRPMMLNYGLRPALVGYVDDLSERHPDGPKIVFEIPEDGLPVMHDETVVLHSYRIVQQACENTLSHAQASTIKIFGTISPSLIDLTIEDDGRGFDMVGGIDLAYLVTRKHFGLAGMNERAMLIGGNLYVSSALGRGTRVQLLWKDRRQPENKNGG